VEDDENDIFFMQRAMKNAGVLNPIQIASDGQQAIDYFQGAGKFANREEFPLPYLVLLDLKLPRVMGLDVLKWIRQQPEATAIVIILSSSKEEADVTTAYRLGANGYLVKPAEASQLNDMAKSIKDFWLSQNTPPPEACLGSVQLTIR
jgi:two-component system response regulator